MKPALAILFFLLLCSPALTAQNTFSVIVKNDEDGEPLDGVTIIAEGTDKTAFTDSTGFAELTNLPDSTQAIIVSYVGYFRKKVKVSFPYTGQLPLTVKLQAQDEELEEVVVVSTRNDKRQEDVPMRVETISQAEVEERSNDKPSDVSHVLREQPGVQVQRTSATGGTMSIRLQGMKSRYVQVLKDGFPLFGGFANVIGITQIPPLDLKQVEIIKGPSSTLYGGDAIAGVINLITKEPTEKPVYDLMVNAESSKAVDVGTYCSQKFNWFAFSLLGMYRWQKEKDWDGDKFSETPKLQRYSVAPQLYFDLSKKAKLNIGASYTHENRLGGAIPYIQGKTDSVYNYFEKNLSDHLATNFKFQYDFGASGKLTVKNAFNYFNRQLTIPFYLFKGRQIGSASEINYHFTRKNHDLVVGLDFRTDMFTEGTDSATHKRNYSYYTGGFFAQYSYILNKATLEGGLRLDYNNIYKIYALPHLAWRQKWNDIFVTRVNMGMGYKLPNVFQDESEEARFINVYPIGDSVKPEISLGGTVDLMVKLPNYNGLSITLNQMYFLTHIFRPLVARTTAVEGCNGLDCTELYYSNGTGYQESRGVETSIKMYYRGIGLNVVYTLTDNNFKLNDVKSIAPLTSKHIVSILAGYEIKNFAVGIDCYYYSPVKLSTGAVGKGIWEFGIVTQYAMKYLVVFANLENVFDIRQTSFGPIVHPFPTLSHPRFSEVYAPLEGRLFNAGIKLRLGMFSKKNKDEKGGIDKVRGKSND